MLEKAAATLFMGRQSEFQYELKMSDSKLDRIMERYPRSNWQGVQKPM